MSSATSGAPQPQRPLTYEQLATFNRVAEPQLPPDGNMIVYAVRAISKDEEHARQALWLAPFAEGFAGALVASGYRAHGAVKQLHLLADLSRWLDIPRVYL